MNTPNLHQPPQLRNELRRAERSTRQAVVTVVGAGVLVFSLML